MPTSPAQKSPSEEARPVADAARSVPGENEEFALELDSAQLERSSRPEPWRLRHMMYLVAFAAVLFSVVKLLIGSMLALVAVVVVGLIFILITAMGSGVVLAWSSTTKQDALLHVLAIAAEREMPFAPAVAAFSDQYRGLAHRRVMHLAARLNWGTTLAEALEQSRRLVTRDAVLLAWVGQTAGVLPKALRMAADSRSSQLPIWTSIASRIAYILLLLLGMQGIGGVILYYVAPRFESIFRDFNLALPRITWFVIEASSFLVSFQTPLSFLPLLELAILILLPFSFLAWGSYSVPVFDRLLERRHTALVLRSLSLFVEGGKPIPLGLALLANHYPTYWVHRRISRAATAVQGGLGWIEALRTSGVIRAADAAVLASAEAVGNLAWALAELAETAERRLAIRFQLVSQTLFPLVVVMLGMVVFILAVAYFLPLVSLIEALS